MNVNNNNREEDGSDKDKSDESKITKRFDTILKDINSNGRTTKLISFKNHGSNINIHPLIIKLLYVEKPCSKNIMDLMKYLIFLMK